MEIRRSSDRINFHSFSWETVKFSTFVFNKVVRWHEWGEVESVYMTYNFSHFVTYSPKAIKIDENITKFWQKNLHIFFWDTV